MFAQIVFEAPSVEVGRLTPFVETSTWRSLRVQVIAEEQILVGGGNVVVVLQPRLQVRGHGTAGAHEELVVEHATVVAELQVVRAVRRERRVRELDGVRVELTEGDAVDVDGRVILVVRDQKEIVWVPGVSSRVSVMSFHV